LIHFFAFAFAASLLVPMAAALVLSFAVTENFPENFHKKLANAMNIRNVLFRYLG
jgi:hypothetical protein